MKEPIFQASDVLVRVQETPNPLAIKLITNFPLLKEGKVTLHAAQEYPGSQLIEQLFGLTGVKQIYLFQNTVTLTHDGSLDSQDLGAQASSVLKTRLPLHDPDLAVGANDKTNTKKTDRSHLAPEVQEIEEILDRTIRPGLQSDGGDIEVISYESNELKILYQGACGGCPSSMMGTLDAIQNILQHELNQPELTVIPI